jgi:hypothetical protein
MKYKNEISYLWWEIDNTIYNNKQLVKFINENKDDFTAYEWLIVSKSQFLDNNLIENYKDKLDWQYISAFKKLEEKELRKYSDYIDWYSVSRFQNLSLKFIEENESQISFDELIKNESFLETSYLSKIIKMYEERKDKEKYKKIWIENKENNSLFKPVKSISIKQVEDAKIYNEEEILKLSKNEMKEILSDKNVRTYYHDTLEVLRKKIIESQGR